MAKKIVTEVAPRTVYTSPCGRARVELHGRREYLALLDDQPCGFHAFAFQAEHAAGVALTEALGREAIQLADEAAERDEQQLISDLAELWPIAAAAAEHPVSVVPVTSERPSDGVLGHYYRAGGLDIFVANRPEVEADHEPTVYLADGRDGIPLGVFEQAIPLVLAVLSDPRFRQARAALASGSPLALPPSAETEDAERGVIYADAGPLQIGVDSESVLLTLELPLDALKAMRALCDNPAVARLLRAA